MNVLVTGSNGYIGRWIANHLKREHTVIGCGRNDTSLCDVERYVRWDISDFEIPEMTIKLPLDAIVHVAASVTYDDFSESLVMSNCVGTFNITRLAVEKKCKKLIYFSGLPVVGKPKQWPITEQHSINPSTMYHATKAAGENIAMQAIKYGVHTTCLRIPSPVAPDMPVKTILPIFIDRALNNQNIILKGKGTRKQNYLDVRDLCECVELILDSSKNTNGIYNVGGFKAVSNKELAELCIKNTDSKSMIAFEGVDENDDFDWTTSDVALRNLIGEYQHIDINQTINDVVKTMIT